MLRANRFARIALRIARATKAFSSGKESIHRPAPVQKNFCLPKNWGPQRKDFGGRYGLPGFYRVFLYPPPAWKVFLATKLNQVILGVGLWGPLGNFCKCFRLRRIWVSLTGALNSGKSKRGLSKRGLGPKGTNWAKKGPFRAISALPSWLWGAEELVPTGPEKPPKRPQFAPKKARFSRKDLPPIFSENLGLKPPFVSPRLDFPNESQLWLVNGEATSQKQV